MFVPCSARRTDWFVGAGVGLAVLLFASSGSAQILINEVCADNGSVYSPGATIPDYLELYNSSTTNVTLNSTWSLTDDITIPNKWTFPNGTVIAPNGFLVIWLDTVNNYTGLVTTNFSLRASGEQVALYRGSTQLDYIRFGPQIKDTSLSRYPTGNNTWTLGKQTPGATNVSLPLGLAAPLRINEILATNSLGSDWLEFYNPSTNGPVAIGGMVFSQTNNLSGVIGLWPNGFIGSGDFIQFLCTGDTNRGDHLNFKLSSTLGETIYLYASDRTTLLDAITFGPQTRDVSYGRLPDGGTNFFLFTPTNRVTPAAANNWLPITNIFVNELLIHTDPPLEDAVELMNTTDLPVDVSNWWLSNSPDQPLKFRIPSPTIIPAHGFKVFFEMVGVTNAGFNRSGTGNAPDFTFNSAHGDQIVLTVDLASGAVTGYQSVRNIPASANGVAFTRYEKSDGGTDLVPESRRTFGHDNPVSVTDFRTSAGATNAYPLIGPIIITEIMYRPPDILAGGVTIDNVLDEFVELTSVTNIVTPLYDEAYPTNTWHVEGGISFRFPTNISMTGRGAALIVAFDPMTNAAFTAAFRTKYNINTNVTIFGPYAGKLSNASASVNLYKPDPVQLAPHPDVGYVPSILVEKVKYDTNTWPAGANGTGQSLQRVSLSGYGNDQTNWFAAAPNAGSLLSAGPPPAITTPPAGQLTAVTSNVTFSVTATGSQPITYYWRHDGTNVLVSTNSMLLLTNVQTSDSGAYDVVVANSFGSATSTVATLSVAGAPHPVAVVRLTDGTVQVTMEGQVGHVYDLLATSNFVDWVLINHTTNSVNQQIILDLTATNQPMRFYRGEVLR